MPNNVGRTNIKKSAITKKALKEANVILGLAGQRLCKYTGELLELNATNFHKSKSDFYGFQPVSKLGKKLYNTGLLEVKEIDRTYLRFDKKTVATL